MTDGIGTVPAPRPHYRRVAAVSGSKVDWLVPRDQGTRIVEHDATMTKQLQMASYGVLEAPVEGTVDALRNRHMDALSVSRRSRRSSVESISSRISDMSIKSSTTVEMLEVIRPGDAVDDASCRSSLRGQRWQDVDEADAALIWLRVDGLPRTPAAQAAADVQRIVRESDEAPLVALRLATHPITHESKGFAFLGLAADSLQDVQATIHGLRCQHWKVVPQRPDRAAAM